MFHRYLLLAFILSVASCGAPPSAEPTASEKALIQGDLTENSFRDAVARVLPEARAAMSDQALTEDRLDKEIAKVEALVSLAKRLNVDMSQLSDAELTSTLGAMYTRKAGFHSDNAEQAGALAESGFRYLDRAVGKYPDNLTARINRGLTCADVPEFMNKAEVAQDDLRFVLQSPAYTGLPTQLQVRVKSTLQEVERRLADAGAQR
jgi:hypothetical protein